MPLLPNLSLTELVLIVVSIAVACVSWKFIELPFRAKARHASRAAVFGVASTAMVSALPSCTFDTRWP